MTVTVRAEGLSKRFAVPRPWRDVVLAPRARKYTNAVDRVSFEVAEGEVFGLLGQNGAGKTTIFKMLSTLIVPDSGTATVDGGDVVREGERVRRSLAPVIANERSLHWRLNARENLRLYATLQGLHGTAQREECTRVLGVVGLEDAPAMVGTFSSGMRQRLLIARALLGRPRVLLLDEPTRSLDPVSARQFREFLRRTIVAQERCTVLLATHDAEDVWDLCDRVAILERGRLLETGPTRAIRERAGTDSYRLWIRTKDAPRVTARALEGVALARRGPAAEPGWDEFEAGLTGGADATARLLAALSSDGIAVARLERIEPSLADVIERVVARGTHTRASHDAVADKRKG